MYIKAELGRYHLDRVCKEIAKRSEYIIHDNMDHPEQGRMEIKYKDKIYDNTYAILSIMSKVMTVENLSKTIGQYMSSKELCEMASVVVKPTRSTVSRQNTKMHSQKKNNTRFSLTSLEDDVAAHLSGDYASMILCVLISAVYNKNKIIYSLIEEAVETALYEIWSEDYGDLPLGYTQINCALLYYWAYKNYPCIEADIDRNDSIAVRKSNKKSTNPTVYRKRIREDETLDEFLKEVFGTDKAVEFALKYIDDAHSGHISLGDIEYINIKAGVEALKDQARQNKRVYEKIKQLEKAISDTDKNEFNYTIISRYIVLNCGIPAFDMACANMLTSFSIDKILDMYEMGGCISYLYYMHKRENMEIPDKVKELSAYQIATMIDQRDFWVKENFVEIVAAQIPRLVDELENFERATNSAKARSEQLESNNQDIKRKVKEIKRQLDEVEKQKREVELQLTQYRNRDKLGFTMSDIEKLKGDIETLEKQLEESNKRYSDLARVSSKKDKEIQQLTDTLDKTHQEFDELNKRYEEKTQAGEELSIHRQYNMIPIQCFINSIKDKNIVLVGGDVVFTRLQEYGLNNIKTISASKRTVTPDDVSGIDILVIMTSYISHPMTNVAETLAENYGVKVLHFNNKNIEMLVYSLFEELTK